MTVTLGERKCCVNCSAPDSKIIHHIKFVTFGQDVDVDSRVSSSSFGSLDKRTDTEYKVRDILSSIYHMDHLNILANTQQQQQQKNAAEEDEEGQPPEEEEIGVCPDCATVLSNLGKYYHEFNKLRQLDSFMSKKISELDSIINSQAELIQKLSSQQQQQQQPSIVNNHQSQHNLSDETNTSSENNDSVHNESSSSVESEKCNDDPNNSKVNNCDKSKILSTTSLPIIKLDRLKPEVIAAAATTSVKVSIKQEDTSECVLLDALPIKISTISANKPSSSTSKVITTAAIKSVNSFTGPPPSEPIQFDEEVEQFEYDDAHNDYDDEDEPVLVWSSYSKNSQYDDSTSANNTQEEGEEELKEGKEVNRFGNQFSPNIYLGVRSTKFTCTACKTDFSDISTFGAHLRSVHCPYPCGVRHCPKIFATEAERKEHMSSSIEGHGIDSDGMKNNNITTRSKVSTAPAPVQPPLAKRPRIVVTNVTRQNKEPTVRRIINYRCPRCLLVFTSKLDLVCHLPTHPGFRCALECPSCFRICTSVPSFIGHLEKDHKDQRQRRCTICKQSYPCVMTFDAHFKHSHMHQTFSAGQEAVAGSSKAGKVICTPSKCRRCSKTGQPVVGNHMDCCNPKPSSCSKCGRPVWPRMTASSKTYFPNKMMYNSSSKVVPPRSKKVEHHNNKDDQPLSEQTGGSHQCNMCDKKFFLLYSLQAHQKTHSGKH